MKLKTALIAFLLVFTAFLFSGKYSYASRGCCNGNIPGKTSVYCLPLGNDPNVVCPEGINSCDTDGNITSLESKTDIDGDGSNDPYNTSCFIPIQAPGEVKIRDFGRLFSGAVSFLLLIAFILAFFYLILGGISWLTSGGDKANVETARNKIIAAIIGLIIVAATWALFSLVGGAIGFDIFGAGGFKLPTLY